MLSAADPASDPAVNQSWFQSIFSFRGSSATSAKNQLFGNPILSSALAKDAKGASQEAQSTSADSWPSLPQSLCEEIKKSLPAFMPSQVQSALSLSSTSLNALSHTLDDFLSLPSLADAFENFVAPKFSWSDQVRAEARRTISTLETAEERKMSGRMWAMLNFMVQMQYPDDEEDVRYMGEADPEVLRGMYDHIHLSMAEVVGNAGLTYGFRPLRFYDAHENKVVLSADVIQPGKRVDYWCISHVWGSVTKHKVTMEGVNWDVPISNLAKLDDMKFLMRRSGIRYWWMDVLCIDQDDEADKVAQVTVMGNVYANAMGTLVYEDGIPSDSLAGVLKIMQFAISFEFQKADAFSTGAGGFGFGAGAPGAFGGFAGVGGGGGGGGLLSMAPQQFLQMSTMVSMVELIGLLFGSSWETRVWTLQEKMLSAQIATAIKLPNGRFLMVNSKMAYVLMKQMNPSGERAVLSFAKMVSQRLGRPVLQNTGEDVLVSRIYSVSLADAFNNIAEQWELSIRSPRAAVDFNAAMRWLSSRECYLAEDRVYGAKWLIGYDMEVKYGSDAGRTIPSLYAQLARKKPITLIGVPGLGHIPKASWQPVPSTYPNGLEQMNELMFSSDIDFDPTTGLLVTNVVVVPISKLKKQAEKGKVKKQTEKGKVKKKAEKDTPTSPTSPSSARPLSPIMGFFNGFFPSATRNAKACNFRALGPEPKRAHFDLSILGPIQPLLEKPAYHFEPQSPATDKTVKTQLSALCAHLDLPCPSVWLQFVSTTVSAIMGSLFDADFTYPAFCAHLTISAACIALATLPRRLFEANEPSSPSPPEKENTKQAEPHKRLSSMLLLYIISLRTSAVMVEQVKRIAAMGVYDIQNLLGQVASQFVSNCVRHFDMALGGFIGVFDLDLGSGKKLPFEVTVRYHVDRERELWDALEAAAKATNSAEDDGKATGSANVSVADPQCVMVFPVSMPLMSYGWLCKSMGTTELNGSQVPALKPLAYCSASEVVRSGGNRTFDLRKACQLSS
ncbi:hypothetical protein HK102_001406, partial [Quaeritorhiza haematococci]